jgi:hypothetical protein
VFLEISKAVYLSEYKIHLIFNSGESKIVDLSKELKGKVFEPLRNLEYFKSFIINYNTIEWDNGADFAPEYLYEIGK